MKCKSFNFLRALSGRTLKPDLPFIVLSVWWLTSLTFLEFLRSMLREAFISSWRILPALTVTYSKVWLDSHGPNLFFFPHELVKLRNRIYIFSPQWFPLLRKNIVFFTETTSYFFNQLIEVSLTYKKLHIFNIYNLMNSDICMQQVRLILTILLYTCW